jgi:hypothetical protein
MRFNSHCQLNDDEGGKKKEEFRRQPALSLQIEPEKKERRTYRRVKESAGKAGAVKEKEERSNRQVAVHFEVELYLRTSLRSRKIRVCLISVGYRIHQMPDFLE